MSRSLFGFAVAALVVTSAPVMAADYAVHPRHYAERQTVEVIDRGRNPYCGPKFGCPEVNYVRHRVLIAYHPSGFDPRTLEAQEPRYAYGRMKTYAQFVDPIDHNWNHFWAWKPITQ